MHPLRFSELSESAKSKARKDYMDGWRETHPHETEQFGDDMVSLDGGALFSADGTFVKESTE